MVPSIGPSPEHLSQGPFDRVPAPEHSSHGSSLRPLHLRSTGFRSTSAMDLSIGPLSEHRQGSFDLVTTPEHSSHGPLLRPRYPLRNTALQSTSAEGLSIEPYPEHAAPVNSSHGPADLGSSSR